MAAREAFASRTTGHLTAMNKLLPISRLPPELMARIFMSYMNGNPHNSDNRCQVFSPWMWYAYRYIITQVCHDWREVALQNARLWAEIHDTSPAHVTEMLLRSKQAPLKIRQVHDHWHEDRDYVESYRRIFEEIHRIRDLELFLSRRTPQVFDGHQARSADCLQVLRLRTGFDQNDAYLLPFVSSLSAPHLQELDVESYSLPFFKMLLLPSLTSFAWSMCRVETTVPILLELLRDMPLLHNLILSSSLVSKAEEGLPKDVDNQVALRHLHYLEIECMAAPCADLLAHLSLPSEVKMHISVVSGRERGHGASLALSQSLKRVFSTINGIMSSQPLRVLQLEPYGSMIQFQGWTTVHPDETVIETVVTGLSLSDLSHLHLLDQPCDLPWRQTFQQLVNVTHLRVKGVGARGLTDGLRIQSKTKKPGMGACSTASGASGNLDACIPLFPRLECIRLERIRFYEAYSAPGADDFVEQFKLALKSRESAERKLRRLEIVNTINCMHDEVEFLSEVVEECTWDGEEELGSDEADLEYPYYYK
ncbi:hypothetical protein OE88DRAFT_1655132 [Heliocybe sulcata]|uniref:Uncharacterized protein n=1 Tax=Heliocybe sulcata TaxID=5364 RepID=A0A5C3NLG2_9AGAM|nr:hypothetical protein OE88DRAFT_1655132 [Heliocybe sulcata]